MTVEATHDGRGHVTLQVTIRRIKIRMPRTASSAKIVLRLDAGEQMTDLAREMQALLTRPSCRPVI